MKMFSFLMIYILLLLLIFFPRVVIFLLIPIFIVSDSSEILKIW